MFAFNAELANEAYCRQYIAVVTLANKDERWFQYKIARDDGGDIKLRGDRLETWIDLIERPPFNLIHYGTKHCCEIHEIADALFPGEYPCEKLTKEIAIAASNRALPILRYLRKEELAGRMKNKDVPFR